MTAAIQGSTATQTALTPFQAKSLETKNQLLTLIEEIFPLAKPFVPQEFAAQRITIQKQKELSDLDQRTKRVFELVIVEVYIDLLQNKKDILASVMMFDGYLSIPHAHAKIVKEAALPFIKSLIRDLDKNHPAAIDEALKDPLSRQRQHIINSFHLAI